MTIKCRSLSTKEENFIRTLLLIAAFGGIIRIAFAFFLPLESDEAYQLLVSKVAILPMIEATINVHAPLWSLVLHSILPVTSSHIIIRFLTVILGVISIMAIGLIGKIIFNPKTAIAAAVVFALSPTQIYYSANLRMYSLSILVSLLSFLFFIRFLKSNSKVAKLLLFLSLTVGNYTYYLFPLIPLSLFIYLFINKKKLSSKLGTFAVIFGLSLFLSLPLFLAFLSAEPLPKIILPEFSLEKIILIPIHYTFAQNLALMIGSKIYQLNFVKVVLLGLSFTNIAILLSLFSKKIGRQDKFLFYMLTFPIIVMVIFSLLFFSISGLRSILIFSAPFYLLVGHALAKKGRLIFAYLAFSLIAVFSTLIFFIEKPPNGLDLFLSKKAAADQPILHTEITTFLYYSYKFPELEHEAAIDSLYTPKKTKAVFGYIPINQNDLKDKNFWLIEVLPSPLHKDKVAQFKIDILKNHKNISEEIIGDVAIYEYAPL